jgi:CRP/FNR family transcriptional regulator
MLQAFGVGDRATRLDVPRSWRVLRKGEVLIHPGDRLKGLFFVRSGSLRRFVVDAGGHELVCDFSTEGDLVGADALYSGRHDASAVALDSCTVEWMSADAFARAARDDAAFQRAVHEALARRLVRQHQAMMFVAALPARARLAGFLLSFSKRTQSHGQSRLAFMLPMPRRDMASYLGMTPETCSRELSRLIADGLIRVDSRRVELPDVNALAREACSDVRNDWAREPNERLARTSAAALVVMPVESTKHLQSFPAPRKGKPSDKGAPGIGAHGTLRRSDQASATVPAGPSA